MHKIFKEKNIKYLFSIKRCKLLDAAFFPAVILFRKLLELNNSELSLKNGKLR